MFTPDKSVLLIIDVQGQLARLMHDKENLFKNLQALIQAAQILEIPIIVTEQAPEKIGATVPEINQCLQGISPIEKASFSCCLSNNFKKQLKSFHRRQIIVAGIETHVCVYQTVHDLLKQKYDIQVVANAVSSRTLENKTLALERIKFLGATLTSTEMMICELLRTSVHPKFKDVLKLIK